MKLFKKARTTINSVGMSKLIFESSKNMLSLINELLNRIEYNGDKLVIETNLYSINIELCRLSLYNGNDDEIVNKVIESAYNDLLYECNNESDKQKCRDIISIVQQKFDRIFSADKLVAPKERYVYRLFLEQLGIREDKIQNQARSDFIFYAKSWINNADMINKMYIINNSEEDKKKNEQIDFRF